jgi:nitroreductase
VITYATSEQMRHVVQAAGLAPSVHNTQPWRFVARPKRLELRADGGRRLRVLDPDGRQLHASCGAALFHARVGARAIGVDVRVTLLPDPADPDRLADLVLTPGAAPTDDDVRLASAILARHTYRGAFDDKPVPDALLEVLRIAAEAEGAQLHRVVTEDDLVGLEVLLARADAMERTDDRYVHELTDWVHSEPTRSDGIPVGVLTSAPGSSLRQRDFADEHAVVDPGGAPAADHAAVVVVTTDDDSPLSWLQAGQALASVLLHAAEHGVQAQPLGQVTDIVAYRLGLRSTLGLMGIPQLVLRMGYASRSAPTPRRAVDDVLTGVPD